jgi:hypothetical protein
MAIIRRAILILRGGVLGSAMNYGVRTFLVAFAVVVTGFDSFWARHIRAQEDSPAVTLAKRLLIEGWERTPSSRNDSQSWFDQGTPELQNSVVVRWAYALNRMHHRKYRDAIPLVDAIALAEPNNWDVVYAQIWLAAFSDEFDRALILMRQLKQQMDASPNLDPAQRTENYFRMGRMIGYMQGPQARKVAQPALDQALTLLQDGAGDEPWKAFTEQRDAVIRQYEQLMAERQEKHDTTLESMIRQRAVDLESQTNLSDEMERQTQQAQSARDKTVAEGQAKVDELRQTLDALTAEWNRQQAEIATLRYDIGALWFTIQQIDDALRFEKDPVIRAQLIQERAYYLALVRDREYLLTNMRATAGGVFSEMAAASVQYDETRGVYQSQVNELDQTIASAQEHRSRAQRKIRNLQAEPKVSNTLVASIDAQADALSSYDPFPAELLKLRLLDQLAAAN